MNPELKRNLQVIFSRVSVKCNTKTARVEGEFIILDLFREEIRSLILLTVLDSIRLILFNLSSVSYLDIDEELDVLVILLMEFSAERVLHKLRLLEVLRHRRNVTLNNTMQISECAPLLRYVFYSVNKAVISDYEYKLLLCVIESLVINLSNAITYRIFSINEIRFMYLQYYSKDSYVFKEVLRKYVYYDFSINYLPLSMRNLYTRSYSLHVITKKGLTRKDIYDTQLFSIMNLSFIQRIILWCLSLKGSIFLRGNLQKKSFWRF